MNDKKTIKTEINNNNNADEIGIENILRPQALSDYIGQKKIKESVDVAITSAKIRNTSLEHILLYGPAGLGKTTLAYIIANEMNSRLVYSVGPNIEKPGDVAGLLCSLHEGDVLFIDEIHRVNKQTEECLYTAMEDGFISIVIGQGEQSKTIKMTLPHFTLIGATTRTALLSKPLLDRFSFQYKLDYYTVDDLSKIVENSAKKLGFNLSVEESIKIASVSRGTPRIANRNLKLVRDYAYARNEGIITCDIIEKTFDLAGINVDGLNDTDLKLLTTLWDSTSPIGLSTLSHVIGEDAQTIEDVFEPFLLMNGYIEITSKGRRLSEKGQSMLSKLLLKKEVEEIVEN